MACRSSGLPVVQWCEENGIVPNTYFRHQRRVVEEMTQDETFYEIPVDRNADRVAVRIEVSGLTAEIFTGADEKIVRSVLQAMKIC